MADKRSSQQTQEELKQNTFRGNDRNLAVLQNKQVIKEESGKVGNTLVSGFSGADTFVAKGPSVTGQRRIGRANQNIALMNSGDPFKEGFAVGRSMGMDDQQAESFALTRAQSVIAEEEDGRWADLYAKAPNVANVLRRDEKILGPQARALTETMRLAVLNGDTEAANAADNSLIQMRKLRGLATTKSYYQDLLAKVDIEKRDGSNLNQVLQAKRGESQGFLGLIGAQLDQATFGQFRRESAEGWLSGGISNEDIARGGVTATMTNTFGDQDLIQNVDKDFGTQVVEGVKGAVDLAVNYDRPGSGKQLLASLVGDQYLAASVVGGVGGGVAASKLAMTTAKTANIMKAANTSYKAALLKAGYLGIAESAGGSIAYSAALASNAEVTTGNTFFDAAKAASAQSIVVELGMGIMGAGASFAMDANQIAKGRASQATPQATQATATGTATPEQATQQAGTSTEAANAAQGDVIYFRSMEANNPKFKAPKLAPEDATPEQRMAIHLENMGYSTRGARLTTKLAVARMSPTDIGTYLAVNEAAAKNAWDGLGTDRDVYAMRPSDVIANSKDDFIKEGFSPEQVDRMIQEQKVNDYFSRGGDVAPDTKLLRSTFEEKFGSNAEINFAQYVGREAFHQERLSVLHNISFDADVWAKAHSYNYATPIDDAKQRPFNLSELPKPNETYSGVARHRALREALGKGSEDTIASITRAEKSEIVIDAFEPVVSLHRSAVSTLSKKDPAMTAVFASMNTAYTKALDIAKKLNNLEGPGVQAKVETAKQLRGELDELVAEYTDNAKVYFSDGVEQLDILDDANIDSAVISNDLQAEVFDDNLVLDSVQQTPASATDLLGVSPESLLHNSMVQATKASPELQQSSVNAVATLEEEMGAGAPAGPAVQNIEAQAQKVSDRLGETSNELDAGQVSDNVPFQPSGKDALTSSGWYNALSDRIGERSSVAVQMGEAVGELSRVDDGLLVSLGDSKVIVREDGTFISDENMVFSLGQETAKLIQRIPYDRQSMQKILGINDETAKNIGIGVLEDSANDLNAIMAAFHNAIDDVNATPEIRAAAYGAMIKDVSLLSKKIGHKSGMHSSTTMNASAIDDATILKDVYQSLMNLPQQLQQFGPEKTRHLLTAITEGITAAFERNYAPSTAAGKKEITKALTALAKLYEDPNKIADLTKLSARLVKQISEFTGISSSIVKYPDRVKQSTSARMTERALEGNVALTHPVAFMLSLMTHAKVPVMSSVGQMTTALKTFLNEAGSVAQPIVLPNVTYLGKSQTIGLYREKFPTWVKRPAGARADGGYVQVRFRVAESQLAAADAAHKTGYGQVWYSVEDIARAAVDRDFAPKPIWDLSGTTMAPIDKTINEAKGITTTFTAEEYKGINGSLMSGTGTIPSLEVYKALQNSADPIPATVEINGKNGKKKTYTGRFELVLMGDEKMLAFVHEIPASGEKLRGPITATHIIPFRNFNDTPTFIGNSVQIDSSAIKPNIKPTPEQLTSVEVNAKLTPKEAHVVAPTAPVGPAPADVRLSVGENADPFGPQEFVTGSILDLISDMETKPSVVLYGVNAVTVNPKAGPIYFRSGANNNTFSNTDLATRQGANGERGAFEAFGSGNVAVVHFGSDKSFKSTKVKIIDDLNSDNPPGLVILVDGRTRRTPKGNPSDVAFELESKGYRAVAFNSDDGITAYSLDPQSMKAVTSQSREGFKGSVKDVLSKFVKRNDVNTERPKRDPIPADYRKVTVFSNVDYSAEGGLTPQALEAVKQLDGGKGSYVGVVGEKMQFSRAVPMAPDSIQALANLLKSPDLDPNTQIFIGGSYQPVSAIPDDILRMLPPANGSVFVDPATVRLDLVTDKAGNIKGLAPHSIERMNFTPMTAIDGVEARVLYGPTREAIADQLPEGAVSGSKVSIIEFKFDEGSVWKTMDTPLDSKIAGRGVKYLDEKFGRETPATPPKKTTKQVARKVANSKAPGNLTRAVIDATTKNATQKDLAVWQYFLEQVVNTTPENAKALAEKMTSTGKSLAEMNPQVAALVNAMYEMDMEVDIGSFAMIAENLGDRLSAIPLGTYQPGKKLPGSESLIKMIEKRINSLDLMEGKKIPFDPRLVEALLLEVDKKVNGSKPNGLKAGYSAPQVIAGLLATGAILGSAPILLSDDDEASIFDSHLASSAAIVVGAGLGFVAGGKLLRKYQLGSNVLKPLIEKSTKDLGAYSILAQSNFKSWIQAAYPTIAEAVNTAHLSASQDIRRFRSSVLTNHQRLGISVEQVELALTQYSKAFSDLMKYTGVIDVNQRMELAFGKAYFELNDVANGVREPGILDGMVRTREQAIWILDAAENLATTKINYESMPGAYFADPNSLNLAVNGSGFDAAKFVESFHKDSMGSKLGINEDEIFKTLRSAMAEHPHLDPIVHASNLTLAYMRSGGPKPINVRDAIFALAETEYEKLNLKKAEPTYVSGLKNHAQVSIMGGQFSAKTTAFSADYSFLPKKTVFTDSNYNLLDEKSGGIPVQVNSLTSFANQFEALAKANHSQSNLAHLESDLSTFYGIAKEEHQLSDSLFNLFESDTAINLAAAFDPEYADKGVSMKDMVNTAALGNWDAFAYLTKLKTDVTRIIKEPLQTIASITGRSGLLSAGVGALGVVKDLLPFTKDMTPREAALLRYHTAKFQQTHMVGVDQQIELSLGQRYQARSERPLLENYGGAGKFIKKVLPMLTVNPSSKVRALLRLPDDGNPIHIADIPQGHTMLGQFYNGIVVACADMALQAADFDFGQTIKAYQVGKAGKMDMAKLSSIFNKQELDKIKDGSYSLDELADYKEKFMDAGISASIGSKAMALDTQMTSTNKFWRWTETFTRAPAQILNSSIRDIIIPALDGDQKAARYLAEATGLGLAGVGVLGWFGFNETRQTKMAEDDSVIARMAGYMSLNICANQYTRLASSVTYALFSDDKLAATDALGFDQLGIVVGTAKDALVTGAKSIGNGTVAPMGDFAMDQWAGIGSLRKALEYGMVDGMATPYSNLRAHKTSRTQEFMNYVSGNLERGGNIKPLNVLPTWIFTDPIIAQKRKEKAKEVLSKYKAEHAQLASMKRAANQIGKAAKELGMGDISYMASKDARAAGIIQNVDIKNRLENLE